MQLAPHVPWSPVGPEEGVNDVERDKLSVVPAASPCTGECDTLGFERLGAAAPKGLSEVKTEDESALAELMLSF